MSPTIPVIAADLSGPREQDDVREAEVDSAILLVGDASNEQSAAASLSLITEIEPVARPITLGDLLYADPAITWIPEKDWLALVRAIAAGQENALRVLFEKSYPLVFTYLMRLTGDRSVTESLVLEVFEDVWCEAPVFDAIDGPVLGWIMRQARSSALAHVRSAEPLRRGADGSCADTHALSENLPGSLQLQAALAALTMDEREALETVFVHGSSYAEVAARHGQSIGTIKKRIRSGLSKLRRELQQGDAS